MHQMVLTLPVLQHWKVGQMASFPEQAVRAVQTDSPGHCSGYYCWIRKDWQADWLLRYHSEHQMGSLQGHYCYLRRHRMG